MYHHEDNDLTEAGNKILTFGTVVSENLQKDYPDLKDFKKVAVLISID